MSIFTAGFQKEVANETPSLFVHYQIKGNNLFVDCVLTGISFRETDYSKEKVGKMIVWVDGKKLQEVSAAAFIIKGLPPGEHKLKLEVVKLTNEPYGLMKEFMVNIPK
jgi:hypothetical protein